MTNLGNYISEKQAADDNISSWEEILQAREARVERRARLMSQYSGTIICFSMNIPGAIKRFHLADLAFREGDRAICRQLERSGISLLKREVFADALGMSVCYVAEGTPREVKERMCQLEESSPIGRLYDIDVFQPDGTAISRCALGLSPRKCFLCQEDARICAGRRLHSVEELQKYTMNLLKQHTAEGFVSEFSALTTKALLYELAVTPKPGLVDRRDSGIHTDMDFFTFLDAISVLTPHFANLVRQGICFEGPPDALMRSIRFPGKKAESAMYAATGGVNTHKGAIFSLGILCAAAGYCFGKGIIPTPEQLRATCVEMCAEELKKDFLAPDLQQTRGTRQYQQYRLAGARGEAASGFASAWEYGLPAVRKAVEWGWTRNDAGLYALLHLLARVNDSNLIGRSDLETQQTIHTEIQNWLKREDVTSQQMHSFAEELCERFCRLGISPGGCADLLSVSFLFYFYGNAREEFYE